MNIKSKLIEQLEVLENLQLLAINSGAFDTALSTSRTILDYIKNIEQIEHSNAGAEEVKDDECKSCYRASYIGCAKLHGNTICPKYEEAMATETLHHDISKVSGLPVELVKRVLGGEAYVMSIPIVR